MDAHVQNEVKYLLEGTRTTRLVHLILSSDCLRSCGIDPGTFVRYEQERASECGDSDVVPAVDIQTRRHVDGSCSEWRRCVARYVSRNAIASVLVPKSQLHPEAFTAAGADGGGMFLSAAVECDESGRIDPFDALAVRVSLPYEQDFPRHVDVMFFYDELTIPGTRYGADSDRLPRLCAQFAAYAARKPAALGSWSPDVRSKMVSIMRKVARDGGGRSVSSAPVDVAAILDPTVGFDESAVVGGVADDGAGGAETAAVDAIDAEVRSLLQKASEAVGRSAPAGLAALRRSRRGGRGGDRGQSGSFAAAAPRRTPAPSRGGVVSGLRQGAEAYAEEYGCGGGDGGSCSSSAAPPMLGLEPAGCGRFAGGTADARAAIARASRPVNATDALDDVLIFGGDTDRGPESLSDLLDAAFVLMSGGDSQADAWRRRPISIVAKAHLASGATFYVVSYDKSSALGGRTPAVVGATRIDSPSKAMAAACVAAGSRSPSELPNAEKERLAEAYPGMRRVLFQDEDAKRRRVVQPFSVSSEAELAVRFSAACSRAVAVAVASAVRSEPRLDQIFSYDTLAADEQFVDVVAARVPAMLTACVGAICAERGAFRSGAVAAAALSFLVRSKEDVMRNEGKYVWFGTGIDAAEPAGCYATFGTDIAATVSSSVDRRDDEYDYGRDGSYRSYDEDYDRGNDRFRYQRQQLGHLPGVGRYVVELRRRPSRDLEAAEGRRNGENRDDEDDDNNEDDDDEPSVVIIGGPGTGIDAAGRRRNSTLPSAAATTGRKRKSAGGGGCKGRRQYGKRRKVADRQQSETCYVFDYYSSAGECVRVSKRPIPVLIDSNSVRRSRSSKACEPCRFPDWFKRLRRECVCENYLPGESYAYICVGYTASLSILIVLPGGFVLRADASEYFTWDADNAGTLDRAFRKIHCLYPRSS